jgi:hypothetical protein
MSKIFKARTEGALCSDRLGIKNNYHKSFFKESANIKGVPIYI